MADERVSYEVAAKFTGEGELRRAAADFENLGRKAKAAAPTGVFDKANAEIKSAQADWQKYTFAIGAAAGVMFGATRAVGALYGGLREGAVLQTTAERFEKLAAQINSTGDALLGKLREATKGMISDAELMASASGIVSLKLADNEEQVVRLATVVGTLGWDMQQVILTFANLSTMRLDALGLSVDEVKQKQKELMDQGMSTAAAFKEAVIQAGEARLDVGGVSETEEAFKRAEAAAANFKNTLLETIITTLDQAGAFDALTAAAQGITAFTTFTSEIEAMRNAGQITQEQYNMLNATMRRGGIDMAEAALQAIKVNNGLTTLHATQGELIARSETLSGVLAANGIAYGMLTDEQAALAVMTEAVTVDIGNQAAELLSWSDAVARAVTLAERAQWGREAARGAPGSLSYQYAEQYGGWDGKTGREARAGFEEAEIGARAYGGALSYVDTEAQKAAEAHSRFLSSFNEELRAKPEDGLYNAEGVANVEAVNKALYEQVEAAGASAATLALLGVATGQFTQEQAEAALKAAVLQEQIRAIAASVAAGDLSIGDALGQLNQAREALDASNLEAIAGTGEAGVQIAVTADTSTAETNLDGTAAQLDALTNEEYIATVGMDINAVIAGTTEASRLIDSIPDTKTMTIRWEQSGADVIAALRALGIIV